MRGLLLVLSAYRPRGSVSPGDITQRKAMEGALSLYCTCAGGKKPATHSRKGGRKRSILPPSLPPPPQHYHLSLSRENRYPSPLRLFCSSAHSFAATSLSHTHRATEATPPRLGNEGDERNETFARAHISAGIEFAHFKSSQTA